VSTHELLLPTVSDLDGTEVFRAIQSSGAVVQVPYTAITAESNPPVSGLTALTGANTADGDLFQIYDLSVTTNKKQTAAELALALRTRFALTDYANDAAAAVGSVPVGGLYHTSGTVKVRVS
jgi:hypothetical protein